MQSTGSIFWQDDTGTIYRTEWSTVNGDLDITSTVYTPYVWGQPPQGYVDGNRVFRRGIISVTRQVLRPTDDGYVIVAEGGSQSVEFFQTNFPCGEQPKDTFKHHLDCAIQDQVSFSVTDGPRWADPDDPNDDYAIWGDVNADGTPATDPTTTADDLEWIDVWS